jgi:hypothetical protein
MSYANNEALAMAAKNQGAQKHNFKKILLQWTLGSIVL